MCPFVSGSGAVILGLAPELPEWRNACDRVVLACQKFLELFCQPKKRVDILLNLC